MLSQEHGNLVLLSTKNRADTIDPLVETENQHGTAEEETPTGDEHVAPGGLTGEHAKGSEKCCGW